MGHFLSRTIWGKPNDSATTEDGTTKTPDQKDTKSYDGLKMYLLQELECPVCYEVKTGPIFQCGTGHNVCSFCRPNLKGNKCAVCRVELSSTRNFLAEEFISKLVGVPCKNVLEGCTEFVLEVNMARHLSLCSFSYSCMVKKVLPPSEAYTQGDCVECKWRGSFQNIMEHVETDHPGHAFRGVISMTITDAGISNLQCVYDQVYLLAAHKQLFWCRLAVHHVNDTNMLTLLNHSNGKLKMHAYAQHIKPPKWNVTNVTYSCKFKFSLSSLASLTMSYERDCLQLDDEDQGLQICACLVENKGLKCTVSVREVKELLAIAHEILAIATVG